MKLMTYLKGVAFAMLAMMCSCTSDKEKVTEFLTTFATAVDKGDRTTIAKCYPAAAEADSLVFSFDPAKMKFEKTEGGYSVENGNGVKLIIVKEKDDLFTIKETTGLFAWPDERMKLALKTGWVEEGMNDLQRKENLSDTAFLSFVEQLIVENANKCIVLPKKEGAMTLLKEVMGEDRHTVTIVVENKTDVEIPKEAYTVSYTILEPFYPMGENGEFKEVIQVTKSGKLNDVIPPGGKATFTLSAKSASPYGTGAGAFSYNGLYYRANINIDTHHPVFRDCYKFTGNEYKDYIAKKK